MGKKCAVIGFVSCSLFLLLGCVSKNAENQSKVVVSGIGTVLVQPDMVQMNIMCSHVAQTTKEAREDVDKRMLQILAILKEEGIEDKNIKTQSLSYDAETEYINGRSVQIGQRARQAITVTIYDIVTNPNKFPVLLDKITAIDRVAIRNVIFDTENKTELFRQSRELAYQKALDKATQYAALSGLKITKTLTVSEERSRDAYRAASQSNVLFAAVPGLAYADELPAVPTGEQEVTTEVMVTFLIE